MGQPCLVHFTDLAGLRHSVEVQADSVYEAAVHALRALRQAGYVEQQPGPASRLQVEVRPPAVVHEVRVGQITTWLEQGGSTPMERAKRRRLKELLQAR